MLTCASAGAEQLEGVLGPGDEACLAAGSLGGEGLALRLAGERGDPACSPGHPPAEPAPLAGAACASHAPGDAPADPAARPQRDSVARPAGGVWWGAASGGGRARLLPTAGEARALELVGAGGAALRCVLAAEPAAPARLRARPPPAVHPHQ